jgi:LysM repeat protein
MSVFTKFLIISALVLVIFGGGPFAAYELFLKKPDTQKRGAAVAVVTPTPDPGGPMLQTAKEELAKGATEDGKRDLLALINNFPDSPKIDEAQKILSDVNLQSFFSSEPGPGKTIYTVVRGDSILRIARKLKAPEELIFKANGLSDLRLQPGQQLLIPTGNFSIVINLKKHSVVLLNHGEFFKSCRAQAFFLPPNIKPAKLKVADKLAWFNGNRIAFGSRQYLASSRWITISRSAMILFSETHPESPNVQKPNFGVMLVSNDMEELYALVSKETPVTIE